LTHQVEHVVNEETVAVNYYCSDTCAQGDSQYAGWNGCHEVHDAVICAHCGKKLPYYRWNADTLTYDYITPDSPEWGDSSWGWQVYRRD